MRDLIRKIAEEGAQNLLEKLLVPFLAAASSVYRLGLGARRWAFENNWITQRRLPITVVSVGNLTWGGTGKTPFVKFLTHRLESLGKKVMILTRGYSHDEVRELELGCPSAVIGVGKNRYRAATAHLARELPDVALLDDGFQHRELFRDLNIALVNSIRPFGTGHLVPWGSLREPLGELGRADLIVLTHADKASDKQKSGIRDILRRYAPNAGVLEAAHRPARLFRARDERPLDLDFVRGKELVSVSGIGFPDSFKWALESLGAKVKRSFEFGDHYLYGFNELEDIRQLKDQGVAQEIVVTEKDYLRNPELVTETLDPLVLGVDIKMISGEKLLDDRLHRLLAR